MKMLREAWREAPVPDRLTAGLMVAVMVAMLAVGLFGCHPFPMEPNPIAGKAPATLTQDAGFTAYCAGHRGVGSCPP